MNSQSTQQRKHGKVFWAEMAPCDHVLQVYDKDEEFIDSLESFVLDGFQAKEAVVLIATPQHLAALEGRLWKNHFTLMAGARSQDHYIALDADDTLSKFMVNNWPDERLFAECISTVVSRARSRSTQVRAFGEMVALLWARGLSGATVRLEHLWTELCANQKLPLLCAYPKSGFTKGADDAMRDILAAHKQSHFSPLSQ